MITIKNYHVRQSKEGKQFIVLELQGNVEMVQSMETGRFYATARRCTISSTFDADTAKAIIGTQMPGRIVRKDCDAYEYTVPETGELIKLGHRWEYQPDDFPVQETKPERRVTFVTQ